jgi:hypothetical protein
MKFTTAIAALSLFAAASAFPNRGDAQKDIKFPVPDGMTVKEGSSKCGDQAQLSCCNKAKYGGDTTVVADGLAAGLLSNLLGAGSAAEGLGAFTECSKLDISRMYSLISGYHVGDGCADIYSPHWCRGYPQPAVQAEHCLLRQQPRKCRAFPFCFYEQTMVTRTS